MSYLNHYSYTIEKFEPEMVTYIKGTSAASQLISECMLYSLTAGGKRIRPMLLLEFCHAYGGGFKESIPFAVAIEMIHTYSLIHDDLPCMDDDDLRRGMPTSHIKYGEDMAVLAGDGLLNTAFEVMTEAALDSHDNRALKAMQTIAKAAGTQGMILGQVADIKYQSREMSLESLDYINCHKTGKLLMASMYAGAVLGGANEMELAHVETIGYKVGLLFQIVDDVLDVVGDEQKLGKKTKGDAKNEKTTYPALLGLEETKTRIKLLEAEILNLAKALSIDTTFLEETVKFLSCREY